MKKVVIKRNSLSKAQKQEKVNDWNNVLLNKMPRLDFLKKWKAN